MQIKESRHLSILGNIIKAFFFLSLLYSFLVAISLMGGSFKLLGSGVAEQLISTTSNPFAGLFIGILATCLMQSSSLTTSMVVALVSGGALTINNAVPIVMGANIGTTITNTLVSFGHISRDDEFERAYAGANIHDTFNILSVIVLMPLQLATGFLDKSAIWLADIFYGASSGAGTFQSPIKLAINPVVDAIHSFFLETLSLSDKLSGTLSIVIAASLIFFSMFFMVKCMRAITASRMERWINKVFSANMYLTLFIGVAVTAVIQASAITTSAMVPVVGAGLITLEQVFPLTVGANIGTTVTAIMAALAGNQAGLAIAFVHLLFNICGTLIFFVPPWTRRIPLGISRFLAHVFVRQKKLAFLYVVLIFFILPIIGMIISRSW